MAAASYETPQRATALVHVTALQITCPAGHVLLPRVISQISSRYIPHGRSDQNIGRKVRSEEHTSELQSLTNLVCRLLLEKKKNKQNQDNQQDAPTRFNNQKVM